MPGINVAADSSTPVRLSATYNGGVPETEGGHTGSLSHLESRQNPVNAETKQREVQKMHGDYGRVPQHSQHEKVMRQPNKSVRQSTGQNQPQRRALNHTRPQRQVTTL